MEINATSHEELDASGRQYLALFENMLTGLVRFRVIFDAAEVPVDFDFLEVNPAFEMLTGLKDVAGKRASQAIPGLVESNPELFERCGRVALTGKPERFEIFMVPLKMWFVISAYSVEKGICITVFDNVTEQKDREDKLRKALVEIENLMRSVPEVLYVLDTENNIIKWSRKTEAASGYSTEELSHKLLFELLPDHDRPLMIAAVNDAYAKGYAEVRSQLVRKDGSTVPYLWSAAPINDGKGNDTGVIGIGRDVSA